jgi:hypothetical protein
MRKGISDHAFAFVMAVLVCALAAWLMFPAKSRGDELSDKTLIAQLAAENMQLRARIAQLEARLSAVSAPAPLLGAPVYSAGDCSSFQSVGACGQASAGACGAADSAGACGQSGGSMGAMGGGMWFPGKLLFGGLRARRMAAPACQ